jgi:alkane 1-monooxygenase
MSAAVEIPGTSSLTTRELAWIWVRHLTSLYIPVNSLLFLWTGPHPWYLAALFIAPLFVAHQLDCAARFERRQPSSELPAWPFDALVYVLAALQLLVIVQLVLLFGSQQGIFSLDMLMVFIVVGGSSGFSIITAHELIHRHKPWEQRLGRLLLCSVLYEHFFTEHLRGHHVRVGTPEDPATARFGEGYEGFFRRTVPAQFRSAWQLEKKRLGDTEMGLLDRRMWKNRIVHGLVLEWGVALGILGVFGLAAFVAFLAQAFMAVRLLEAVNYFEHWGLLRSSRRVQPTDSWDTHSWFTYYGLVGLSRHADHHAAPTRPYQQLRVFREAPVLPFGYVGMVDLVMGRNEDFQRLATQELGRRRLGPFVSESEQAETGLGLPMGDESALQKLEQVHAQQADPTAPREPSALGRGWRSLPLGLRRALAFGGVVGVTALGAHWEAGTAGPGLPAMLGLHSWILGVLTLVIVGRRWIEERGIGVNLSWALAFAAIFLLGALTP